MQKILLNVQSGNPTVVPGSHAVSSPTFQTCETASSTLLGGLSSTQLTPPSDNTNPPVVAGNSVVTDPHSIIVQLVL